jgi:PKD repeat protein
VGQPVTFDGGGSTGPNPIVTYRWGFGDGSTANAVAVQKTYEAAGIYNVTLRVADDQGLENEDTWQITILEAPAAAPTVPPSQPVEGPDAVISAPGDGVVGQPVTFDGGGSTGPNPIVTYRWGFGDGSTANAVAVQKTYDAAGIYNVTLRVTDDQGLENEDTWQITIGEAAAPGPTDNTPVPAATDTPVPEATAPAPEVTDTPAPEVTDTPAPEAAPPSAALGASPNPVEVGQAVTFDASGSLPGSSPIASYGWDFGDGTNATGGSQETHQYSAPGTYTATVTVVDENGMSSSASQEIQVGEAE